MSQELKTYENLNKKFDFLNEKYRELLFNMKRLERDYRSTKRKADQVQKERDTAKSELGKMTTKNSRLENLSKEVTKINRDLRVRFHLSSY